MLGTQQMTGQQKKNIILNESVFTSVTSAIQGKDNLSVLTNSLLTLRRNNDMTHALEAF